MYITARHNVVVQSKDDVRQSIMFVCLCCTVWSLRTHILYTHEWSRLFMEIVYGNCLRSNTTYLTTQCAERPTPLPCISRVRVMFQCSP